MFCPKCGTENTDEAKICRKCSRVITNVDLMKPSPQSRTSAMAIASLVLGLLSLCTMLLTAPLAIIFGIIALIMIAKSQGQLKGIGMAIAGIVIPIVILPILMAILMPALAKVKCGALIVECRARQKQLGIDLKMYAADHNNQYPTADKWCDLLKPYYKDERTVICPSEEQEQHYYAINPQAEPNSPSDIVLLFETKGGPNQSGGLELLSTDNHCENICNILFNDGHGESVRTMDINNLRWTPKQ